MIGKVGLGSIPVEKIEQKEIKKAATEFESIFIYYMLKTMREGMMKGGLFGNNRAEAIYTSLLDEKLSMAIAEGGGIGIGEMVLRWLENGGK